MTTRLRDTERVVHALKAIMDPARIERTCLRCGICMDLESRDTLIYSEEWVSQEDMSRLVHSERFSQLLLLMETAEKPPELQFAFVSNTRGLDYVEQLRLSGEKSSSSERTSVNS